MLSARGSSSHEVTIARGRPLVSRVRALAPIDDAGLCALVASGIARGADVVAWRAPAPEPDGRLWSFVAMGEAARLEAHGPAAIAEIQREAGALFGSLRHDASDVGRAALPLPQVFGGIAFRPREQRPFRDPAWDGFGDASFTLPHWLYGVGVAEGQAPIAFGRVICGSDDREASERGRSRELDALESWVVEAARPSQKGWRAPSDSSGCVREGGRDLEANWSRLVDTALEAIAAGSFDKVVPAASARVVSGRTIDAALVFARLAETYPTCARFLFARRGAAFVGASPERLISRRGESLEADALAGTRRTGGKSPFHLEFLADDKERREHAFVVRAIESALDPLCSELDVPAEPRVRTLRNVAHLHTPIRGRLSAGAHVLELVARLHPTPAVCGTPRDAALAWLSAHEGIDRGWYAAPVGTFDASGNGAFWVAIRSALLLPNEARVYAGAGVVRGSRAGAEYAETESKRSALYAALGVTEAHAAREPA